MSFFSLLVANIQVASAGMTQDGTKKLSVETYQAMLPHIEFTGIRYRHSDRTWASEPKKVLSKDLDSDDIFLKNDHDLGLN